MNAKRSTPAAISVIGMIVVLGIAWALDYLTLYLGKRNAQTFTLPYVILWAYSLSFVLMAALLLLLFWFVVTRTPRNGWVAALYLVVGLFVAFYLQLYMWPTVGQWMPQFLNNMTLTPAMITIRSGAFIAITGLLSLVLPRR